MCDAPGVEPLCLVGMSGVGKSFWARRLADEAGLVVHDCDAEIGRGLSSLVSIAPGQEPVHALGLWMGMPWTAGYAEREARYLALEEEVTREGIGRMEPGHVLDTTGSVVYLPDPLLTELRARCRVVHLRAPEARREAMLARYLEEPKPVVWAGAFRAREGEAPQAALPRAYAELLAIRDRRYAALAHVTLDGAALEARPPPVPELLARITR